MLIEREGQLRTLDALLRGALEGSGSLVFVGGEAGVGKTTLVTEFMRSVEGRAAVRRGTADNIPTADALGPLIDAAPELADALESPANRTAVFRRALALLAATPTVVVLEDLHWADGATLDFVRFAGRRIDTAPVLVIATYRDDEVTARHPLAVVLGDLAARPAVHRLPVSPLSIDGVRALSASAAVDVEQLHERTGGNPFFVTELLASGAATVPATIRDAVLARTARLSPGAQDALAAASIVGRDAALDLVAAVGECDEHAIDECVTNGALVTAGARVSFRHDLARLTIEESLPPGRRAALHARALHELERVDPDDHTALAHHAAASGDWAAVAQHAPAAAERAARLGAHRQAADQYRAALRARQFTGARRAQLFEALSYECYVTEQIEEAVVARQQAMELYELAGDAAAVGASLRWLSRLSWFLGRNVDAERYALRAISTLEPIGDGHELAMAYSNLAQLRALSHDASDAVLWGERALELAKRIDDRDVQIHALNNIGTALPRLGRDVEGRQQLNRSLEMALIDNAHEHAARAYTNLAWAVYVERDLGPAERILRSGIAYCEERDLDSWTRYMRATLVAVLTERGRYDDAMAMAAPLLTHPQLSPISRVPAAAAVSRIRAYRAMDDDELLDSAEAAAREIGESQRLVPVATARAERAWLTGAGSAAITAGVDVAWERAVTHPDEWQLGELTWWLDRAGARRPSPIPVATPFALMLEGRWQDAADAWQKLDSPLWQALALGHDPDLAAARAAVDLLDALGAPAVRTAILRERHAAGLPVPRGPRPTTSTQAGHLTAREIEVLALMADGLSNADLAARLYLSERTVAHHVSAVLRKLGETSRGRAVAAARGQGLLPPT